ncbi:MULTISPECIES: class I SAM-dependent methyltransferase [unclassified Francisella]|uniref:class I SAM-dependent methyltransferase n=1 Tax=unclassified Francisella TaxID=2610885 RepID=UPI002E309527|nr:MULTISPECIES: class I SAM-dependent methyltransferase [unclassified Francisella]MED7820080.1 class I SAM-dependent methyltransferase [Francisella sp. 19S2-4]MED7830900.1 class I SAM-dependent methyltransferase [Francisella sp. 19S2-10]
MTVNILDQETKNHITKLTSNSFEYTQSQTEKFLYYDNNILKLANNNQELFIDFNSSEILSRIDPKSKKCSVIQSVEGRSKEKLQILDTTAGLGRDTFTLASRGHIVTSIEKDIYIYLLLCDALHRAANIDSISHIVKNITLLNLDSNEYILNTEQIFDCIYVDPMFPPRKKSAKVKQDMQILHQIAFNNENLNSQLLKNILETKKTKKVIVKRPIYAEFLYDKKPSSQLKGKTNRFDIYSL